MNYRDVYFSRVNHLGETATEVALNSNIRSFERWLAGSPFTVYNLSVERGLYFSGIIQTSKDKAEKKLMYLYVANDIPIQVGDILTWIQDNGVIEKWLLLQKVHDIHEAYQTFQIIKCNYELKWIDTNGYIKKSWAYAVSSVDEMVKGNFRMWHSLVSPQPNKFAEIIMPRPIFEVGSQDQNQLLRGTTFIIEDEAWVVIECDWTSVDGVIYMSLTESKVNYQYDSRTEDIAALDTYKFPQLLAVYSVGDTIIPQFESDTLNQWEIELIKPKDCTFIDDNFVAIAPGQCIITMQLKNQHVITKNVEIVINENNNLAIYIKGDDEIKLDRDKRYDLIDQNTGNPVSGNVVFSIENKTDEKIPLATIYPVYSENKQIINYAQVIHANARNKLGEVILSAEYNGTVYTKTIKIVPLW